MCLASGGYAFREDLWIYKNIIQGIGDNDKAICCYKDTLMPPAIFRNGVINKTNDFKLSIFSKGIVRNMEITINIIYYQRKLL